MKKEFYMMAIVCPCCQEEGEYNIHKNAQSIRKCSGCGTNLVIDDFAKRIKMTFDYSGKPIW